MLEPPRETRWKERSILKLSMLLFVLPPMLAGQTAALPRVGTVHPAAAAIAYYNSSGWRTAVQAKMAEQKAAQAAGDTAKAAELEKWGRASQEQAHRLLTGEAPLAGLIESLRPVLPEVARRAGVDVVVLELPYARPGVEVVDVTAALLDVLQVDERARKWAAEARAGGAGPHVH